MYQKYIFSSMWLIIFRIVIFAILLLFFGTSPNNDTEIFETLASKNIFEHLGGVGDYYQFPILSPLFYGLFKYIFSIFDEYWWQATLVFFDLIIFSMLYFRVSKFRSSIISKLYIVGFFTAPFCVIWSQDEIIAAVPLMAAALYGLRFFHLLLLSVGSFFVIKNFFMFLPPLLFKLPIISIKNTFIIFTLISIVLVDQSGNFIPGNEFGANIWVLSNLDRETQKLYSLSLFALFYGMYILFNLKRNRFWLEDWVFGYALFLACFYHINSEYFLLLVLPMIILFLQDNKFKNVFVISCIWYLVAILTNVFYVLGYSMFSFDISKNLHSFSLVLSQILSFMYLYSLIKKQFIETK